MIDCVPCSLTAELPDVPPREAVWVDERWRVAHAFGAHLPGWLVVLPRRHVESLDELDDAEAAELGPLLRDATAAVRTVVGCAKTYVGLFAEKEGFAHVHFHVIPRMPDQPHDARGPRIFTTLGATLAESERDAISLRLRAAWPIPRSARMQL